MRDRRNLRLREIRIGPRERCLHVDLAAQHQHLRRDGGAGLYSVKFDFVRSRQERKRQEAEET